MAQLDHTILRGAPVPVPPNSLGSLGRIEAIGQLVQRDRAAKEEREAQALLQQLGQQYAENPDGMVVELRRRGYAKQAGDLENHLIEYKKKVFDARKSQLDGDLTAGKITAEKAEAERKAMEAKSPDKMMAMFAAAQTPEDWANAQAMTKFKFGEEALPFLAEMGEFNPSKAAFAGRAVMGPEKVAIDVDRDLTRDQAKAIADANRDQQAALAATDDARLDEALKQTIAYQQGQLANTRRGQDISAETARRGQNMTDARARADAAQGGTGGVKLSATAIDKVAAVDQSMGMLDDIERLLPRMGRSIGLVDGRISKAKLATGAGVTPELAEFDAQLTGLKNAVIKATTGAAMSEPEAKRIMGQLPDLSQPEAVFKARLATTRKNLDTLKRRTIELSGGSVAPSGAAPKALTAEELIKKYGGG